MQTVFILMQTVFLLRGSRAWSDLTEHGFVFSTDGSDSLSVGRCAREYRVPLLVLVLILTYVPVVLHLVLGTASGPPCIAADSGIGAGALCALMLVLLALVLVRVLVLVPVRVLELVLVLILVLVLVPLPVLVPIQ